MPAQATKPIEFWHDLERRVALKTKAALSAGERARRPVLTYLREVETMARVECDRRETIQLIASARRVLGDQSEVEPVHGPFALNQDDVP